MKKVLVSIVVALIMVSLVFAGGKKEDDNTIKIGGIAPLSGSVAVYGVECTNGVNLAVEEINAAGGINGKKIVYIAEDDEGDPAKSVNAYKKLTTQDGIRMIIGSLTSGCTIALTSSAQAQEGDVTRYTDTDTPKTGKIPLQSLSFSFAFVSVSVYIFY